jgi:tetratricopeptide (TPR) repeat protein
VSLMLGLGEASEQLAAPTDMASLPPSPIRPGAAESGSLVGNRFRSDPGSLLQALELATDVPDSPTAHSRLAQAAFNVGDSDTAIAAAKRALELAASAHLEDEAAVAVATQVLRMAHRLDVAEVLLAPSIGSDTSAEVSAERGRFAEALAALSESGSPTRLALSGWLHLSIGEYEAAVRDLRRCLRNGGSRPDVLTNLGYAYSVLGNHEKALLATSQASYLAPRSRTIAFNLMNCFMALNKQDLALGVIRRIKEAYPHDVKVIAAAAQIRVRCGDPDGALRELRLTRDALDLSTLPRGERAELSSNIAVMEWRLGKRSREDTLALLGRELVRSEYASLGVARMLAGLSKSARDAGTLEGVLTRMQEAHPRSGLWDLKMKIPYLRGRFDEAIEQAYLWERNDPLDESPPTVLTVLLADHRGEYRDAAEHGEAALRRVPASVILANNVAYAWALAGRPDLARKRLPVVHGDLQEKPYLVATEALIELADGNLSAGISGYERAAELLAEAGDQELATFARLRGVVAAAQLGYVTFSDETFGSLESRNDPQYVLLRETIARLTTR